MDNPAPVSGPSAGKHSQVMVRAAAALVMIPPVLACVYFGYPVFDILVALLVVLMAWEWRRLVYQGEGTSRSLWMALGVIYIVVPALALLWLRGDGVDGRNTIFWLLALVWAADTGAYAAGKLIGGPKLAPAISPNKTWAGLAGCVASAALIGVGVAWLSKSGDYLMMAALSGAIGLVSQGGDLLESAIKRHFGVKDSSQLIPGHGGILDRVDALLAAIVVAALIKFAYGGSIIRWS